MKKTINIMYVGIVAAMFSYFLCGCTDFPDEFGSEATATVVEAVGKRTLAEDGLSYSTVFDVELKLGYFTDEIESITFMDLDVTELFDLKKGGKASIRIDRMAFQKTSSWDVHGYATLRIKGHSIDWGTSVYYNKALEASFIEIYTGDATDIEAASATVAFTVDYKNKQHRVGTFGIEYADNSNFDNWKRVSVDENSQTSFNCVISQLTPGSVIYYRAYHEFPNGFRYGQTKQLKTPESTAKMKDVVEDVYPNSATIRGVLELGNTSGAIHASASSAIVLSWGTDSSKLKYSKRWNISNTSSTEVPFSINTGQESWWSADQKIYYQLKYQIGENCYYASEVESFIVDWSVDLGLSVRWSRVNYGGNDECGGTREDFGYSGSWTYPTSWNRWGKNWRIPTLTEMKELLENCIITEEHYHGPYSNGSGHRFTSKINGNSIFLRKVTDGYWTSEYVPNEDDKYYSYTGTSYYLDTYWEDVPTIKTDKGLHDNRYIRPVKNTNAAQ
ncbi:MAG: hypothetical protein IJA00_01235 [Bacteroidaceae bacterium]|nr:hypothetical protein [Bacteroidaceae bacterium]